jgi:hypothetical protein
MNRRYGKYFFGIPLAIGLIFTIVILTFFYITYAQKAWFLQDDFSFIQLYAGSVHFWEFVDLTNFGRFLSRNVYWHYGLKLFSTTAECFYLFNFFTICATSFFLYKITAPRYGGYAGLVSALFYPALPSTIEAYSWIANSQHILGHFFVVLFVYRYSRNDTSRACLGKTIQALLLGLILIMGFFSNIFMCMVLSLPIWMLLVDKEHRQERYRYFVVLFGILVFGYFYSHLAGLQTGAYATSYSLMTLKKNADFYFRTNSRVFLWLAVMIFGVFYGCRKKQYFVAWIFVASALFFMPFAFFKYQRYMQYGTLSYLFCLLGVWFLLHEALATRWPCLVKYVGLLMVSAVLYKAVESPITYYLNNPRGVAQKAQIDYLRAYDAGHPDIKKYCFRSDEKVENRTGVKEWSFPKDWWFVYMGTAYSLLVDPTKTFEFVSNTSACDVVFTFRNEKLELDAGERPR